ncbi:transposable element Tcb1 transposase [Trichonephila clavipes]|nr:transposable element Tcb1 transposase [Trichonephila clavipes]
MQITGNHHMARIVRHNDESVREGYIRNGGKEVKLFTSALKAFQCNNRIVMAQRKHLDDFLRGRIIGRLEWGRIQMEVSEELGITQSVLSRLWQRFQDDVTAKRNRRSTASALSRQLSSATGATVLRKTVYRCLGHIGLYARRPVRRVPLTATHCRLRLTWSREHALWTPQHWSCVMFPDESRFSLQSDSRRTLIWRAPGTRYHQENTIERHRYGGAGWLVRGGIILGSRIDLHVQSVTRTGHIYRDVILEHQVRLFRGPMDAEFLFMGDNARLHRANIVDECLQSEDITRMDWPAYSPDLNPKEHVGDMVGRRIAARQPPPTCLPELRRALLDEWRDHDIKVWDALKEIVIQRFIGHNGPITGLKFQAVSWREAGLAERTLISASEDGSIREWSIKKAHVTTLEEDLGRQRVYQGSPKYGPDSDLGIELAISFAPNRDPKHSP